MTFKDSYKLTLPSALVVGLFWAYAGRMYNDAELEWLNCIKPLQPQTWGVCDDLMNSANTWHEVAMAAFYLAIGLMLLGVAAFVWDLVGTTSSDQSIPGSQ